MRGLPLLVGSACIVLLTGCSPSPSTSPGEASSTPSAPATPTPSEFSDRELVAALPATKRELQGVSLRDKCLTINKTCPPATDSGFAYVDGSNSGPSNVDVAVQISKEWDASSWADRVKECPQGRYERPLEWTPEYGKGAYRPGERGTSQRTSWAVGSWTGFVCQKRLVRLWPKGARSERGSATYVHLNNGYHALRTEGRTLTEVKDLATEYLQRLQASAE